MMPAVKVATSSHGGHSPEAIAEMCVDRLIGVADSAPQEIAQQARVARQQMLEVVRHYVIVAVQEDRRTVASKLEQAGLPDVAQHIRSL
jgi:hypothetical protein